MEVAATVAVAAVEAMVDHMVEDKTIPAVDQTGGLITKKKENQRVKTRKSLKKQIQP